MKVIKSFFLLKNIFFFFSKGRNLTTVKQYEMYIRFKSEGSLNFEDLCKKLNLIGPQKYSCK